MATPKHQRDQDEDAPGSSAKQPRPAHKLRVETRVTNVVGVVEGTRRYPSFFKRKGDKAVFAYDDYNNDTGNGVLAFCDVAPDGELKTTRTVHLSGKDIAGRIFADQNLRGIEKANRDGDPKSWRPVRFYGYGGNPRAPPADNNLDIAAEEDEDVEYVTLSVCGIELASNGSVAVSTRGELVLFFSGDGGFISFAHGRGPAFSADGQKAMVVRDGQNRFMTDSTVRVVKFDDAVPLPIVTADMCNNTVCDDDDDEQPPWHPETEEERRGVACEAKILSEIPGCAFVCSGDDTVVVRTTKDDAKSPVLFSATRLCNFEVNTRSRRNFHVHQRLRVRGDRDKFMDMDKISHVSIACTGACDLVIAVMFDDHMANTRLLVIDDTVHASGRSNAHLFWETNRSTTHMRWLSHGIWVVCHDYQLVFGGGKLNGVPEVHRVGDGINFDFEDFEVTDDGRVRVYDRGDFYTMTISLCE